MSNFVCLKYKYSLNFGSCRSGASVKPIKIQAIICFFLLLLFVAEGRQHSLSHSQQPVRKTYSTHAYNWLCLVIKAKSNQSESRGVSVNKPPVLAAKCANDGQTTSCYRKPVYLP